MKVNPDEVCVLIPTLNEAPTIGAVIKEFQQQGYRHILVMDGHSTDKTLEIARGLGVTVKTQAGRGKGEAIMEAFEHIRQPYVILVDGDGTYTAKDAEKLLRPLYLGFDHAIGDRLNTADKGAFSVLNHSGNVFINFLFKFAHGSDLHDILSGYRAFTMDSVKAMRLKEKGFGIETEMTVEAVRNGQRIMVVPVHYRKRIGTRTKLNPFHDGTKIITTIYRLAKVNNPIFYFGLMGILLALAGMAVGVYVVWEWFQGINHIPMTILTVLLIMVGFEIFMFGVISDILLSFHREILHEIQLLQQPRERR
ncbi:MAG TPA: S-layer glycoprotein N-glycosyltransferase AglJ [Methanomicrobiales archaeon]|jgi:dolichol-phosphate mannosyltransferase|nr:S-layer glycoprotein N-glycosyltransferase AglJ [Methanomicrobiales archaeon]